MPTRRELGALTIATAAAMSVDAEAAPAPYFVAAWTASVQGPYPTGNATAQPELRFAFPDPDKGAVDQSFRLILRPDIWGRQARIRLSNVFGAKPVTFDHVYCGLQQDSATLMPSTNRPVTFGGKSLVTIPPGRDTVSDPVTLTFVSTPAAPMLKGRRLAVSVHVVGETGPMTWHAKALTTSYISQPHAGAVTKTEAEDAYPYSTTSWYFLDAVEMTALPGTKAIVAFGDSLTDGTASTLNGNDRWPDVFSRRLHAAYGDKFAVVNAGIGGNRVVGPVDYAVRPFAGGPAAMDRLDRDVISLANVGAVIWLEGINDFGTGGVEPGAVEAGVRDVVKRLRAGIPGVRIVMATLPSALKSTNGDYGTPAIDAKRKAYNQFIRSAGIFDSVADFDAATTDPATGEMKAAFQPNSSIGGPGDRLHPNRAGYLAMGEAVDLRMITGA
ncbi:MAG TPA: GDSL-type esterase/lipase family protein [Rhodopila sp.]|uniref:GDSL-type esterase/lipase family protein n=1 Tax=Rhodopila sp. TaxID=2480087 RepID=UPI002C413E32|nr:GDSL-type esterase/lipase family protein [Rhodopila sp.]HVY14167.1 GDSL-type esterase/lipase family protein [Rhodopila sp.]